VNPPVHPPASNNLDTPRPRQAGVGLIEVLVAVLVLSLGVLGVAALQTRSLSNNSSTMAISMATVASYSILEAMRADKTNALAGSYSNGGSAIAANSCPSAGSTLATWQLNNWCTKQLAAYLPAVSTTTALISCTATNGSCTVTIQFDDSRAGGSSTQQVKTTAGL
jgi:type IV pilus assembly protein PilV